MKPSANSNASQRVAMETVNERQRAYYDQTNGGSVSALNGVATNLWRVLRQRAAVTISEEARAIPYDIHRKWLGDLSNKTVLDLGCGTGTALTEHLATTAGTYHAIDLSEAQVGVLRERFGHLPNTAFIAGDFLSHTFPEGGYDVIYAHSVLHHFRYMTPLLDRLEEVLAPGGRIITFDPAQAWAPARGFRALFRPFQTDAEWEFPFGHAELDLIEGRFDVRDRIGVYGQAKWAWVLGMIRPAWGKKFVDRWFRQDFERGYVRTQFRKCLVVSYLLQRRGEEGMA